MVARSKHLAFYRQHDGFGAKAVWEGESKHLGFRTTCCMFRHSRYVFVIDNAFLCSVSDKMFRVPSKLSTLAAGSCLSKRGLVDLAKLR